MNIKHFEMAGPAFKNPGMKKYYTVWRNEWKKFTVAPFNSATFSIHGEHTGSGRSRSTGS